MSKIKYSTHREALQFDKKAAVKCGISEITADGRLNYGKKYSIVYELKNVCKDSDIFQLLRFYDVEFKLLFDLAERKKYLYIISEYDSCEAADEDMKILNEDIMNNLKKMNCYAIKLDLDERMKLIHRLSVGDGYINVDSYKVKGDWADDIGLKKCLCKNNKLIWNNQGSKREKYVFYWNADADAELPLELPDWTRYIFIDAAPVSDAAMKLFIENNYLALGKSKYTIEHDNPTLYNILFNDNGEDTKSYVMTGIYIITDELPYDISENWQHADDAALELYKTVMPGGFERGWHRVFMCNLVKEYINKMIEGVV